VGFVADTLQILGMKVIVGVRAEQVFPLVAEQTPARGADVEVASVRFMQADEIAGLLREQAETLVLVTASTQRQTLSYSSRLPENFKMKEVSSPFNRDFTHGVYNLVMWAAGGDQHSEHRITAACGRPLRGTGAGDSSFPYFSPSHLRPPGSHPEVAHFCKYIR
jgi:hypothetical protein